MRIHILGICGTFMSGIAMLAKQMGHEVTGSDSNVYPPMNHQLAEQGVSLYEGYEPAHLPDGLDCVVVGNVIKRGNPIMEFVMANGIPYQSGPEWLAREILPGREVLAIAGTHGKTTTASMLMWLLRSAGLKPGFLIGGIPENVGVSADKGDSPFFVIEADEYDSAFFDKRPKFIHYRPRALILNNLEYDHADIFPNLQAIQQQFHYLIRTVPNNGLLIHNANESALQEVLAMGVYTPLTSFNHKEADWQANLLKLDGSAFTVLFRGSEVAEVRWSLLGQHNVNNALAAIAAAHYAGISPDQSAEALSHFKNVKRRLEVKGKVKNIVVYDDFAHHPTAIETTLAGLRASIGRAARMVVVLEFGSYTMRTGVHKAQIQQALVEADVVVCKMPQQDWGLKEVLGQFQQPTYLYEEIDALVTGIAELVVSGDHVVMMSNTGFGGAHQKLLNAIAEG